MCGRYVSPDQAAIERAWHIGRRNWPELIRPSFNVAPTSTVPVIRQAEDGAWELYAARWGLVPAWWSKDTLPGMTFNARSEEAAGKPTWRQSLRSMRCILPALGWYEWCEHERARTASGRTSNQPYYFSCPSGEPIAIAGLWALWQGRAGPLLSCALLSKEAAEPLSAIHHRMPVVLSGQQIAAWLDPVTPAQEVQRLIETARGDFRAHRVSTRVNSARNDDAGLLEECPHPLPL
jgi:putative SOS response-associated peptidase YedK